MSRKSRKAAIPLPDAIGALTFIFTVVLLLVIVNFSEMSYTQATTQKARISIKELELTQTLSYLLRLEVNGKPGADILRQSYQNRDFSAFDKLVRDYLTKTSATWGISVYSKESELYRFSNGISYTKSNARATIGIPIEVNGKFETLTIIIQAAENA